MPYSKQRVDLCEETGEGAFRLAAVKGRRHQTCFEHHRVRGVSGRIGIDSNTSENMVEKKAAEIDVNN